MTMPLSLVWDLLAVDKASPVFGRVAASANAAATGTERAMARMTAASRKMQVTGAALTKRFTLPIVAIGALSAKMATDFSSAMTKIQTQAGGSARDVKLLSKQVLDLAKYSEHGPTQLAEALYHLKSVGLDNADAMKALRQATDLAAVGGANLEETTNALAGAWRTGIKGATNMHEAVATLNAVIGAGNMKMEDLTAALGTGILPTAKTFGLTLKDVGAALAVFTDESVPADAAATRLRMSMSLLAAPSGAAEKQLNSIGLTGLRLGQDMRKPNGLITAIGDLKQHLDASGLSASEQAALLSRAFGGGRSSSGILSLVNNFDVLRQKQDQVTRSMGKFDQAVKAQRATPEAKFKLLESSLQRAAILLGNQLLPLFTAAANKIASVAEKFNSLSPGWKKFIGYSALALAALGPVLSIGGKLIKVFTTLWAVGAASGRFVAGVRAAEVSLAGMQSRAYTSGLKVRGAFLAMGNAVRNPKAALASLASSGKAGALALVAVGVGAYALGRKISSLTEKGDAFVATMNSLNDIGQTWKQTLVASNGALTDSVRLSVADTLQKSGLADKASKAGISLAELTAAVTGNDAALKDLIERWKESGDPSSNTIGALTLQQALYHGVAKKAKDLASVQAAGNKTMDETAAGMGGLAQSAETAQRKVVSLADAISGLDHGMLGVADAQIAFKLGLKDLPGQLAKNNKGITGNTRAALENRKALVDLLGQVQQHASAMQAAGRGAPAVAKAIDTDVSALERVAIKAGVSRKAFQSLITEMHLTPKQVRIQLGIVDRATSAIDRIRRELANLHGKDLTVAITRYVSSVNANNKLAAGRASGGGLPEGVSAVGERGPELAIKSGSRVQILSNSTSRRFLAATGMRAPGFADGTVEQHNLNVTSFAAAIGGTGADVRSAFASLLDFLRQFKVSKEALHRLAEADDRLARKVNIRNREMDKLNRLVTARRELANGIRGTVIGSFDLASAGRGPTGQGRPTFARINAQAIQQKNIVAKWAAGLRKLAKTFGKSATGKAMLRRLAEDGPDSLPQVQALLAASPKQLASLVSTEAKIAAIGKSVGGFVGNTLYGKQIAHERALIKREDQAIHHDVQHLLHMLRHYAQPVHVTIKVNDKVLATAVATGERKLARR